MKLTKEQYEQQRQKAKARLIGLLEYQLEINPHLKQKEIAKILGVTSARISQLKKEI